MKISTVSVSDGEHGLQDRITPMSIHHLVDEIPGGPTYNYLVYEFHRDGESIRARSYLDDIEEVSLLSVPLAGGAPQSGAAEQLKADVIAYLARRYRTIKQLGAQGYITISRAKRSRGKTKL